jgi:hypothetical protein
MVISPCGMFKSSSQFKIEFDSPTSQVNLYPIAFTQDQDDNTGGIIYLSLMIVYRLE